MTTHEHVIHKILMLCNCSPLPSTSISTMPPRFVEFDYEQKNGRHTVVTRLMRRSPAPCLPRGSYRRKSPSSNGKEGNSRKRSEQSPSERPSKQSKIHHASSSSSFSIQDLGEDVREGAGEGLDIKGDFWGGFEDPSWHQSGSKEKGKGKGKDTQRRSGKVR
jgi:hypothetical protein